MTSKERLNTAMSLGIPDRVPVMAQMSIGHMLLQTGIPPSKLWFCVETYAEALLQLRSLYNFDGILISLHGHHPDWRDQIRSVDQNGPEEVIHWRDGSTTFFPPDDLPRHSDPSQKHPLSATEMDPESLPVPPMYIPVSQGLQFPIHPDRPFHIFDLIQAEIKKHFSLHGEVTSPFDYALHLLGFEELMLAILEHPAQIKKILQRFTKGIKQIACGQIAHGADAIKISSPFSGSGFISPQIYKDFVLPFETQIASTIREKGVFSYLHTCGSINDRLELMAGSGANGLECLDPPPLGDVALADAKSRIGKKMFIKGNMDPINVLAAGPPDKIRENAREMIAVGKTDGGYILSTACSITPHTPPEHVQILHQSVEKDGFYGKIKL